MTKRMEKESINFQAKSRGEKGIIKIKIDQNQVKGKEKAA